jgi:two-component system cell cycle sensor histidine kinase/response regulator CckA
VVEVPSRLTGSSWLRFEPDSRAHALVFVALIAIATTLYFFNSKLPWPVTAGLAALGVIVAVTVPLLVWRRSRREADRGAAVLAGSTNLAWAVTASDGCIIDCNDAYRCLAGCTAEDVPHPPQLGFRAESAASPMYRLARAARNGSAHQEHFEFAPGQVISAAVSPLKNRETVWWFIPRPTEIAAARSGASHTDARAAFGEFFANAPIGVAVVGAGATVLEANAAFREFFSSAGDLSKSPDFTALVEPDARGPALELLAKALSGERSPAHVEILCQPRPNVRQRSAQLFASPLTGASGEEARALAYLIDTSDQRALETQFAHSQKMQAIGQLAGGVAHDFNNLLQAIMGNCDLLLMRHPAGDPSFGELNEVRQNSVRAAGLVRQLLAFSRQQALQPKVIELSDMITDLSLALRRLVGEAIALQVEHGAELWPVHVDEGQIANAIINLVVNSRDAMPAEGGMINIRTMNLTRDHASALVTGELPEGDYVLIEVGDTGCGIPRENLEKIFEPFFTTKPVGRGTGLGLSTVYGVVKQTGGFINVESQPGQGSVFSIYLPRYRGVMPSGEGSEELERAGMRDITGQDTILLVEDEEAVRSFAARALKLRGYTVLDAESGEAALEIVQRYADVIHLLITDVVMPNMDGPTLVRAATKLQPDIRVIYMSGYAEDVFRRLGERTEEVHFLPKPFGLKQLVAKVKEVLSGAAPARQLPIQVQAVAAALSDGGTAE